jgi:16S rRNA C967 or C1407 C5-methylase (RsmB/RsmF family)
VCSRSYANVHSRAKVHTAAPAHPPGRPSPAENEGNVAWAMRALPGLALEAPEEGARAAGGGLAGGAAGLRPEEAALVQRFEPGDAARDPADSFTGFFVARFVRRW